MSQQPPVQFAHSSPDTLQRDVAGTSQPGAKLSKVEANYRDAGGSKTNCGSCANYQGSGICSTVEGSVSPSGVSDLWKPRSPSLTDLVGKP